MNWGNCDYKQLQRLRDSLATLQSMDMDHFCTEVSKELAAACWRWSSPAHLWLSLIHISEPTRP